jgi:hypothetical protein
MAGKPGCDVCGGVGFYGPPGSFMCVWCPKCEPVLFKDPMSIYRTTPKQESPKLDEARDIIEAAKIYLQDPPNVHMALHELERCGALLGAKGESTDGPSDASDNRGADIVGDASGDIPPAPSSGPALAGQAGEKKRINAAPMTYATCLGTIAARLRGMGYALTLHGSMQRDLDLVAIPWVDDAAEPEEVVRVVSEVTGALLIEKKGERQPYYKPHGRLAWSLYLGGEPYIDLGVMSKSDALSKLHSNLNFLAGAFDSPPDVPPAELPLAAVTLIADLRGKLESASPAPAAVDAQEERPAVIRRPCHQTIEQYVGLESENPEGGNPIDRSLEWLNTIGRALGLDESCTVEAVLSSIERSEEKLSRLRTLYADTERLWKISDVATIRECLGLPEDWMPGLPPSEAIEENLRDTLLEGGWLPPEEAASLRSRLERSERDHRAMDAIRKYSLNVRADYYRDEGEPHRFVCDRAIHGAKRIRSRSFADPAEAVLALADTLNPKPSEEPK